MTITLYKVKKKINKKKKGKKERKSVIFKIQQNLMYKSC